MNFRFPQMAAQPLSKLVATAGPEAVELMTALCHWDPKRRPTAVQALQHPYFCVGIRSPPALAGAALRECVQLASASLAVAPGSGAAGLSGGSALHRAKQQQQQQQQRAAASSSTSSTSSISSVGLAALSSHNPAPPSLVKRPHAAAAESSLPAVVSESPTAGEGPASGDPLRRLVQLRQAVAAGGGKQLPGSQVAGSACAAPPPYQLRSTYSSVRAARYRPGVNPDGAASAKGPQGAPLLQPGLRQQQRAAAARGGAGAGLAAPASTDTPTKAFLARQQQLADSGGGAGRKLDTLDSLFPDNSPSSHAGMPLAAAVRRHRPSPRC
jgi:hypothetical protein